MANETMKFLWGKNSKIPSSATNGKAYFAVIDTGYTDSMAPANEAFIYLDKDGNRYNVIAKRTIFDSLGYKITNKYFSETNNSGSNTIQFFTAEQDPSKDTPIKSAAIISAIDLSNSFITASEYKIKTIINGFEDKTTGTNSTLSLSMASETASGLMSAEDQVFGGSKTFTGEDFVVTNDGMIDFYTVNSAFVSQESMYVESPYVDIFGIEYITVVTGQPEGAIQIQTPALDIEARTSINGNVLITGDTLISGPTRITDTTECDATKAAAALKVTGGVLIGKGMQVNGVATFANTTDASSTAGGVMVAGGIRVAKSAYIANNLTVAQAIKNSRNAIFNGSSVTNSYETIVNGYFRAANDAVLFRNVILNGGQTAETTYTTTVKGSTTFEKDVTINDDIIINGDGVFSGDLSVRGGDIFLGAAGDYATITYSSGTITISFPS